MKKFLSILIIILLLINSNVIAYAKNESLNPSDINAEAAILIDGNTGEILFEKNIHDQMFPASTTKILTGILAIEKGDFNDIVTVDDDTPYEIDGTHIALEPGEKLSLKDLVSATLIESANDAAVVVAKHIGGSVDNFAKMMNDKAKEIGAKNTQFTNPNGLPDDNHLTTAYDLAMISKYAMANDTFRNIVKNYKYTIEPTNIKDETRYLYSANKLLFSGKNIEVDGNVVDIKYDGAIGVKTGYTTVAQQCYVAGVERNGRMLISVVLKSTSNNVWIDTHKLMNYGFENFENKALAFKNEFIKNIEVEQGDKNFVTGIIGEDVSVTLPKGSESTINKNVVLDEKIEAPITKGQIIGQVEYNLDGKKIASANIVSTSEINLTGVYKAMSNTPSIPKFNPWWLIIILIIVIWRIAVFRKRSRRRKRKYSKNPLTYKGRY